MTPVSVPFLAANEAPPDDATGAGGTHAGRRRFIAAGGAALVALGAPAMVRAQATPKIRIGFWPVALALPFFVAIEKGYFKEAGLDVEPLKFASAQQVMEAMLSGRAAKAAPTARRRPSSRSARSPSLGCSRSSAPIRPTPSTCSTSSSSRRTARSRRSPS